MVFVYQGMFQIPDLTFSMKSLIDGIQYK